MEDDMSAVMVVPKLPRKIPGHSRFAESLEYQVPGFPFLPREKAILSVRIYSSVNSKRPLLRKRQG